jgi:PAS domain S-box-containing protein
MTEFILFMAGASLIVWALLFYPGGRITRWQYQKTLRDLPIGVFSLRANGQIQLWNRSMEGITGISGEQAVGAGLGELSDTWSTILRDFVDSGMNADPRKHLPDPHGPGRWIGLHKAAVQSTWHRSQDMVIVVEDLTDYEMLEQELMHSERLASVGRLAAGVAHEIGNPVTGISSLAQNLAYEEDLTAVHEAAADILLQTERVNRIVESLVNFSHTGKGNVATEELQALNVADCVDEAVHLLRLDHKAKPVQFENRCHREHLVRADSQRLLQVFINLLGNARDASNEEGLIEVDSSHDTDQTTITVTDHGAGIPPEIHGQIFEPFFTTKEPGQGTGLGLSLVYSILENLNGRILLQSPLPKGTGTCFSITLHTASYQQEYSHDAP